MLILMLMLMLLLMIMIMPMLSMRFVSKILFFQILTPPHSPGCLPSWRGKTKTSLQLDS